MRTLQCGAIEFQWIDDEFKADWRGCALRIYQDEDSDYCNWAWRLAYHMPHDGEERAVSQTHFDRAQTAADDLATLLAIMSGQAIDCQPEPVPEPLGPHGNWIDCEEDEKSVLRNADGEVIASATRGVSGDWIGWYRGCDDGEFYESNSLMRTQIWCETGLVAQPDPS